MGPGGQCLFKLFTVCWSQMMLQLIYVHFLEHVYVYQLDEFLEQELLGQKFLFFF